MKMIDVSISNSEIALLSRKIGTRLHSFRCDPFSFNNWVYHHVGILFEDSSLILKNELHVADYYGVEEDVCWFEVCETTESEIVSGLANVQQIDIPFDEILSEILLIQEERQLYVNGELTYHVKLTRGLVFHFSDSREIAFEKTDPFSEEIAIRRGTKLANSFTINNDPDEWEEGAEMHISLEVVSL